MDYDGFETNLRKNFNRKQRNYNSLINDLKECYSEVTYVNFRSIGACRTVCMDSILLKLFAKFEKPAYTILQKL